MYPSCRPEGARPAGTRVGTTFRKHDGKQTSRTCLSGVESSITKTCLVCPFFRRPLVAHSSTLAATVLASTATVVGSFISTIPPARPSYRPRRCTATPWLRLNACPRFPTPVRRRREERERERETEMNFHWTRIQTSLGCSDRTRRAAEQQADGTTP